LKEWQGEMPKVPSAYQPSGALPASALLSLTVGAFVGALAGGGVAFLGGALMAALGMIVVIGIVCAGLLSIPIGILGLLFSLLTFVLAGWISARCTTLFGRWGKNRNIRAAVVLSAFSGALSALIAWGLFHFLRSLPALADKQSFGPQAGGFDVIPLVFALLGGAVAAFIAGYQGADQVHSDKFCESCERFMGRTERRSVTLGGLRALTLALKRKDLDAAAALLHAPSGEAGKVELFTCSNCSRGYVELTATFKALWKKKKDKKEKSESWLVASLGLAASDLARFRSNT